MVHMKGSALQLFGLCHHLDVIFMVVHSLLLLIISYSIFFMESKWLTRKLVRWAFILQEYDFNVMHSVGRDNWDASGLNQNPSSKKEDTTKAHWHGDVDFEALPSWHVYGYMPTTLQCIKDVLEARLVVGNPKKRIGNMVP